MINIHEQTLILRPVNEVFAFVTDERHHRRWMTEIESTEPVRAAIPPAIPISRAISRGWAGIRLTTETQVAAIEPNRRYATIESGANGKFYANNEWRFEPAPGGTLMSVNSAVTLSGALALITPIFAWQARRTLAQHLRNLKHILES